MEKSLERKETKVESPGEVIKTCANRGEEMRKYVTDFYITSTEIDNKLDVKEKEW